MNKLLPKLLFTMLFGCLISSAYADSMSQTYEQKTLPDGSIEMNYTNSDGSKLVSVKHPDGTTVTTATDEKGNKTVTTQHPDGKLEVQTIDAPK